jgi:hypothetical protein
MNAQVMKYEFCDTNTGKTAPITDKMAVAFVKKAFGPCSSAQQEQALMQLERGFCFSVDGGIVRLISQPHDRVVAQLRRDVMSRVNSTLFPVTIQVTRREFLALPLSVRRRAMRQMVEDMEARKFQAVMDQGDEE